MAASRYDLIVVGGGHNGLVCAAYAARAGARTLVLEARDRVGGAADTSTPFPDHPEIQVSTYSYVVAVMPPSIVRDLELARHGYRIAPVWGASHLLPDGSAVQIFNDDPQRTHDSIARFSKRDAERYPQWQEWIGAAAEVVGPLLLQVPPRMGSLGIGDLFAQAQVAWRMRKLGLRGVADLTRLFAMSVSDLLDDWFESDAVKGAVASGAVIVGVAILASGGILWFAASRAIGMDGLTADMARLFQDLNTVLMANVMNFGLVVLIGAAGVGGLSTGVLPAWLGWASMVIAVGLLTPIHYIFEAIGFVWIAAVSLQMLRGAA